MAVASAAGIGKQASADPFFRGAEGHLRSQAGFSVPVGAIPALPALVAKFKRFDSRNNRLLALLCEEIRSEIDAALARFGAERVAIVVGTSTSGIDEGQKALGQFLSHGAWPPDFRYGLQELGNPAEFLSAYSGARGPSYVIGTACSSSAKAFVSGRRMLRLGLADAVIVGGADSLCALTVSGFSALEAVSQRPCNPFSAARDGISIGEGGALFLMTREPAEIALLGVGESSDAHHLSAPDPTAMGARIAIELALGDAGIAAGDISYVNLHGTGTRLNDAMESVAVHALLAEGTPCSSTKSLTGHCLGAAGAVEAAICWLTLSSVWNPDRRLPPHIHDGVADPDFPPIRLVRPGDSLPTGSRCALSLSFAFGGNNCALIFGKSA
jgi:3-oxoacyl-[acyl-carrier-protein] synthase-1